MSWAASRPSGRSSKNDVRCLRSIFGLLSPHRMAGEMVKRIYFSQEMPVDRSELAEEIAAHLEGGAPCPKAELDMSACTDFQKQIYALVQAIPRGRTMTYGEVRSMRGQAGGGAGRGPGHGHESFCHSRALPPRCRQEGLGWISLGHRDEGEATPSGKGIE